MKRIKKILAILTTIFIVGQSLADPVAVLANEINQTEATEISEEQEKQVTETTETSEEPTISNEISTINEDLKIENIIGENQKANDSPLTGNLPYSGYTSDGDRIEFSISRLMSMLRADTGNSSGKLTKYYSATMYISTPYITINGEPAWCVAPDKGFPVNIEYAKQVYNDEGIYNILYYAVANGWNQENENYVDVFVAINAYLNHSYQGVDLNSPVLISDPNVSYLLDKANKKDAPIGKFDFQNKKQTAGFDAANKLQKTDWYTPVTDSKNVEYTLTIPNKIGLELSDGRVLGSGTHTISQDIKFRLTAPANYTGTVKLDVPTNLAPKAALKFTPIGADVQELVKPGGATDPIKVLDLEATFFARLGNLEFQKLSEFSNLPMEGVTYKVEEPGKAVYEMKTDAEGKIKFNDVIHGTKIDVTEVANPIGWVLDPTTYSLTAEAGETLTKPLINSLQMGRIKGLKNQRVLDTVETKKQGTPVYKYIPLAGAIFDLVAERDILLPDGKTVYVKAGTVVDTVVTDEKGYFESTKDFLIGEDNFYRLVETNVPEGFRPPSENQTLFSIPNGNNTEKLIVYDMGTINNDLETGKLKFLKQDLDDLFGIAGAKFTVEMMSGLYAGTYFTFTTKATGNEFELPAGDWRLTEIVYPISYIADPATPQTQWVTIKDNETIELKWNNKKTKPVIQTKAHTADGSQTFTHGDVLAMYDDVSITHDTIDGTKGAFETLLYAILPDGTQKMIWKSDMIDYVINDKEFVKTVVTEKVDTSKYPEGTYFSFKEINYDDKGKENGRHNDDLTEKSQSIYPKETPKTPVTPSTPTKTGSLPSTGETIQSTLLMLGLTLMTLVFGLFFFKKVENDELV